MMWRVMLFEALSLLSNSAKCLQHQQVLVVATFATAVLIPTRLLGVTTIVSERFLLSSKGEVLVVVAVVVKQNQRPSRHRRCT